MPICAVVAIPANAAPEVLEIGPADTGKLPTGKEADGIIGDFVLRNDRIEALISQNAPLRRANMSTFYGDGGETPGCLYDLTLRGRKNDQLTIFAPLNQRGKVSYVRILKSNTPGEAAVETVITAPTNKGLSVRHIYRLRDGLPGLFIDSHLRNANEEPLAVDLVDKWTSFPNSGRAFGVNWGDAVDPADKAAYAYTTWLNDDPGVSVPKKKTLAPDEEIVVHRYFAVGNSPLEAVGEVLDWQALHDSKQLTGRLSGRITDPGGKGVSTARITLHITKKSTLTGYPDKDGRYSFSLPPGNQNLEFSETGREPVPREITIEAGPAANLDVSLGTQSAVLFDIRDSQGQSTPCKVNFSGRDGTPQPNLGPNNRAHGCVDQYHSEIGAFTVPLPPGKYRAIVTRGPEHNMLVFPIDLKPGETVHAKGTLVRAVDSRGWVSTDFHNHSTPSGDNTCGTDDRIINLAAEHIEFAPTTEHNRIYDWAPHIVKLGLANHIKTIVGIELTGKGAHWNSFPFKPSPYLQDGGGPVWKKDPRLNAITLREFQGAEPDRWVQINHPDMVENFIDRDLDGIIDHGFAGLGGMIDGVETQNYLGHEILGGKPFQVFPVKDDPVARQVRMFREFIWLQLLNQGHRIWGTAVADAHTVHGNGVGGWRTYIPSSTDNPAEIDWREIVRNAKRGRMILTTAPFLQVTANDGLPPGDTIQGTDTVNLNIKVQCADWYAIDRVQVMVNGRQPKDLNFTRKKNPGWFADGVVQFDRSIPVKLREDAHLIVVVTGEQSNLSHCFGSSTQAKMQPTAYNNPVFVDIKGDGFTPNHDTLDYPLPTGKMTVEQVEKLIGLNRGK